MFTVLTAALDILSQTNDFKLKQTTAAAAVPGTVYVTVKFYSKRAHAPKHNRLAVIFLEGGHPPKRNCT